MSSLSWIFGKKKSGTDGPSAAVSPKTFEEAEGFAVIGETSSHLYPPLDGQADFGGLPYDVPSSSSHNPTSRPPLVASDSVPHNPLQDIPFKLNSQLDFDTELQEIESFLFNINAVLVKAVHVNENIIKYNFATERSVINEERYANSNYS